MGGSIRNIPRDGEISLEGHEEKAVAGLWEGQELRKGAETREERVLR